MTEHSPYYIEKVVAYYLKKKEASELADCFRSPTPANFRDECIAIAHRGIHLKDHKALMAFFKKAKDANGLLAAIEKCDIDKFRPLQTFLKTLQTKTDEKNIDLLAWMIDYPNRPYDHTKKALMDLVPSATANEETGKSTNAEKEKEKRKENKQESEYSAPVIQQPKPVQDDGLSKEESESGDTEIKKGGENKKKQSTLSRKKLIYIGITSVLFFTGIYFYPQTKFKLGPDPGKGKAISAILNNHQSCMYWTGDHYEQIPCNKKKGDTLIVPLDTMKLLYFKRIIDLSTISKKSIGHVWYAKLDRTTIEFYTADGDHPLHSEHRLLPLTPYMLKKYIKPNTSTQ